MVDTVETSEMCETRDLGFKWPQWHALILERASKSGHEMCLPKRREENALETGQVSLLEAVGSEARVLRIEGRFLARASSGSAAEENKRRVDLGAESLFDIGWSGESKCQACQKEEGAEKAHALQLPRVVRGQTGDPRGFQKVGAKIENLKEGVEVAKRDCNASSRGESEKHKNWSMPAEGFKDHVATDGSLLGTAVPVSPLLRGCDERSFGVGL